MKYELTECYIRDIESGSTIGVGAGTMATELVRRANAYDGLLAACKAALHSTEYADCSCALCHQLRAAIAAAEGGA